MNLYFSSNFYLKEYIMKKRSLFWVGFKVAAGAYLGWEFMRGVDQGVGKFLAPRLEKVHARLESKRS
jgi:hypothetical protein